MRDTKKHSSRSGKFLADLPLIGAVLIVLGGAYVTYNYQSWTREHIDDLNSVDGFHYFYYHQNAWQDTTWLGVKTLKLPLDLMVVQEILFEKKPDVIIEAGTAAGGSALYMATLQEAMQHGKVITVDIVDNPDRPVHDRITYVLGSSTAPETVERVKAMIPEGATVMVVLDSDHSKEHVLNELRIYSEVVTEGQYMIAEDTNVNGRPAYPNHGPGPGEAVDQFLAETDKFTVDKSREKYLITFNPGGFLLKTSE